MSLEFRSKCLGLLLSGCLISVGNAAEDDATPPPMEPQIATASDEAEQAMGGIKLPAGWKISLFAAEPAVANIVAFDVDNLGRVFVCESFRQNRGVTDNRGHDEAWLKRDLAAQTVQDRIDYHLELLGDQAKTYVEQDDRVRLLIDTDGDGKADQSTVYADRFNRLEDGSAAGVLARGKHVYLTNIPKLYNLVDSDGDGRADERIVMSDGYGVRVAFRGHDMHGLVIGPDGRLYFSIGDRGYHVVTQEGKLLHDPASGAVFRCELDGSNLEVFATGLRNPQELAFNDYGDLFTGDNNSDSGDQARLVHVLQDGDSGWRMFYQYLPDRGPFNQEKIWEPFHDAQPAYLVPPIINFADGPSGFTYYPGTGFGDELKDTFLLADFRGSTSASGIRSVRVEADGAFYAVETDDQPIWSVLATDVTFGPDGAIYISDWVNGWNGEGKGRIYRITHPEHAESAIVKEVQTLLAGDWEQLSSDRLATLISHTDRRIRFEAQWQLAARGDLPALIELAADDSLETIPRLHAIWGMEQVVRQGDQPAAEVKALINDELMSHEDEYLRAAAAKFAGEHAAVMAHEQLLELLTDDSSRVRYFAARAVGQLQYQPALPATVLMLAENDNRDPALRHAGIMALAGLADESAIAELADHSSANVRRAAVVALRRLASTQVARFLADGDERVIAEAARAIHDLPLSDAMPQLAALIGRPMVNLPTIRRVLNANFRLGTPATATALANYASQETAPEEMRLQALAMLGDWATPDERDRVLNDWRPLPDRDQQAAKSALRSSLADVLGGSEKVRNAAISLAADLGLEQISPLLVERLDNTELSAASRAAALRAMSKLTADRAVEQATRFLSADTTADELQVAAIEVLAELAPQESLELIIAATDEARSSGQRQAAWDALATINADAARQQIAAGVARWLAGDAAADSALNVIEAARATGDETLVKSIDAQLADQVQTNPLAKWMLSLSGGDAARGETIFFTKTELSCVRCHKVGPRGGEVGPQLTTIGREKDLVYLLESIVTPDSQIAKGYETTILADDYGVSHVGIVRKETEDFVDLVKADGSQVRIMADEIVARRRGQSAMPNDLINYMSARELRDLVAYLASLKEAPADGEGGHQVE